MTAHVDPAHQHATYAPSSAHRWTVCTASAEAIAALPDPDESEEAAEGTRAHDEIERCLGHLNDRVADPLEIGAIACDLEHPAAYGISLMFAYLRGLPAGRLWIEQRVVLTPQIWGRCDVAHYGDKTLTIIDYKNGFVGVDAQDNEQLQIYAAASIYTHKLDVSHVRLVVVQPNDFRPLPRVKQHVMPAEQLHNRAAVWAAVPGGIKTFKAGEHCRYCPLFGRCEATRDLLAHLATALQYAPEDVPPATRVTFLALRKPLDDWFKGADKAWTKDALAGKPQPGLKLVQTTKHRTWIDESEARAEVVAALGVDALELPTPAQAEKLGMEKTKVAKLAAAPPGGPALAFESDKRAEWKQKDVGEMFADVTVQAI